MNNEPVAWLHIQGDYSEAHARPLDKDEIARGWEEKPLYTHPVKELTDEEIEEVFYSLEYGHSANEFARAILRKASEK